MSLNHLKHIPCPAGGKCTSLNCLFQHQEDRDKLVAESTKQESPLPLKQGTRRKQDDDDDPADEQQQTERPQKRVKADPGSPKSSTGEAQTEHRTKRVTADPADDDTNTSSSEMAIWPTQLAHPTPSRGRNPSLSPRTDAGVMGQAASAPNTPRKSPPAVVNVNAAGSKSATHITKSTAGTVTPTPKTKKPEILNPRGVNPPPAQFKVRYQLLRHLYLQFSRLNGELKRDANKVEEKLVLSDQELIVRANEEEWKVAIEKAPTYTNVMKNRIMQYKKMSVAEWKEQRINERKEVPKKREADDPLGTPLEVNTGLTPAQEVHLLSRLLTPIDALEQHGYVTSIPTDQEIEESRKAYETAQGWEKCDRCDKRFQVFPGRREEDGALTSGSTCVHHPGKVFWPDKPSKDSVQRSKRYRCCGEDVGDSAGCTTGQHHVFKTRDAKRLASVVNFAKTPENGETRPDRAICFDCEMGYTVHGLELIRLTATSWPAGEDVLDVLVKPKGEILDLNSRYSGVYPRDIVEAEPWSGFEAPKPPRADDAEGGQPPPRKLKIVDSPEAARDLLFSLLTPDTPLIGHGLENDLNAVRVIHPTLIDTVLLFPHRMGLPYRLGLKMLMSQRLNKAIQAETSGEIQGHDSSEDARAAGELVRLKVAQEWKRMQRDGWKLENDKFVPPSAEL